MKDISIKVKDRSKKDEKSAEVFIEGEFTIAYVEKVKEKLLDVVEQYEKIEVKIQNLENLDLSAIQLLISLRKSLPADKIKLTINLGDDLRPVLEHAGLKDILLN